MHGRGCGGGAGLQPGHLVWVPSCSCKDIVYVSTIQNVEIENLRKWLGRLAKHRLPWLAYMSLLSMRVGHNREWSLE